MVGDEDESSHLNVVPIVFDDNDIGRPAPSDLLLQAVARAALPVVEELSDKGISKSGPCPNWDEDRDILVLAFHSIIEVWLITACN